MSVIVLGCVWKLKIPQSLYYSGKFQMFYQKAAVWGRWCLNLVFSDFMHHCVSHPSANVLPWVNIWNCQSHIICELLYFYIYNIKITKNYYIYWKKLLLCVIL